MKPAPSAPRGRIRRPGFSLVEILVSIAIIAVLVTIVFMVTSRARTQAQQANAMTALRQVVSANMGYATENQGEINTVRWNTHPKEGAPGGWVSNTFWGRFQPYLFDDLDTTNQGLLRDQIRPRIGSLFNSSDPNTMAGTVISGARIYKDGSGLPIPLAFNIYLFSRPPPADVRRMQNVGDPSRVIYATYGSYFFDEEDGQSYVPMKRDGTRPDNNIFYLDGGRAIASFLDGRVEILNPPFPDRYFR